MYYFIFDTETTGLPKGNDFSNIYMVQIAWRLYQDKTLIQSSSHIIFPENFTIPYYVSKIHGITDQKAIEEGIEIISVLKDIKDIFAKYLPTLVAHNVDFDIGMLEIEFDRNLPFDFSHLKTYCTMKSTTDICNLKRKNSHLNKWPKLEELNEFLFGKKLFQPHNALYDVEALSNIFFKLLDLNTIKPADSSKRINSHISKESTIFRWLSHAMIK